MVSVIFRLYVVMYPNNEILLMAYTILYTFLKLYTVNQKFKKKCSKKGEENLWSSRSSLFGCSTFGNSLTRASVDGPSGVQQYYSRHSLPCVLFQETSQSCSCALQQPTSHGWHDNDEHQWPQNCSTGELALLALIYSWILITVESFRFVSANFQGLWVFCLFVVM